MDHIPIDIFDDLMLDVVGKCRGPPIAASELKDLAGPPQQTRKVDFPVREQHASDGFSSNLVLVAQEKKPTSLSWHQKCRQSVSLAQSNKQAANNHTLLLSLDSRGNLMSLGQSTRVQTASKVESSKQASSSSSVPSNLVSRKDASMVNQADQQQSGSSSMSMGQASINRLENKEKKAQGGLSQVIFNAIMQEMVGTYEATEDRLGKLTIPGMPQPVSSKTQTKKHDQGSKSSSRPMTYGPDLKRSRSSTRCRRSCSPQTRSRRKERERHHRRTRRHDGSLDSSSSENRRHGHHNRSPHRRKSKKHDKKALNKECSSQLSDSLSSEDSHHTGCHDGSPHLRHSKKRDEKVQKKSRGSPPLRKQKWDVMPEAMAIDGSVPANDGKGYNSAVPAIERKTADPVALKLIQSLLAYSIKTWKLKLSNLAKPLCWFLFDETSVEYKYYRLKLLELQNMKCTRKEAAVQTSESKMSDADLENASVKAMMAARQTEALNEKLSRNTAKFTNERMQTLTAGTQTDLNAPSVQKLPVALEQPIHRQSSAMKEVLANKPKQQPLPQSSTVTELPVFFEKSLHKQIPAATVLTTQQSSIFEQSARKQSPSATEVLRITSKQSESCATAANRDAPFASQSLEGERNPKPLTSEIHVESKSTIRLQFPEVDATTKETAQNLARFLVEIGPELDGGFHLDMVSDGPEFWFLHEKQSPAFKYYQMKVAEFRQASHFSDDLQELNTVGTDPKNCHSRSSKHDRSCLPGSNPLAPELYDSDCEIIETQEPEPMYSETEGSEVVDSESDSMGSVSQESEGLESDSPGSEPEGPETDEFEPVGPEDDKCEPQESKPQVSELHEPEPEAPEADDSEPEGPEADDCEPQEPESHGSKPQEPEPQGSKPEEPEHQRSEPQESESDCEAQGPEDDDIDPQRPATGANEPLEPEPQGSQPQKPVPQGSEPQKPEPQCLKPPRPKATDSELLVTCCSDQENSDFEDASPLNPEHNCKLEPVESQDEGRQSSHPLDWKPHPKDQELQTAVCKDSEPRALDQKLHPQDMEPFSHLHQDMSAQALVQKPQPRNVEPHLPLPQYSKSQVQDQKPQQQDMEPQPPLGQDRPQHKDLESHPPLRQDRKSQTQDQKHQPLHIPGIEPVPEAVSSQPQEEIDLKAPESTASVEAMQSASSTQSPLHLKRGRPQKGVPVPPKKLRSTEEPPGAAPVMTVSGKPKGRQDLKKTQSKQAASIDTKTTKKEAGSPQKVCKAMPSLSPKEKVAADPDNIATAPAMDKLIGSVRRSTRPAKE